jgi:phosphoglycolate phosphatase
MPVPAVPPTLVFDLDGTLVDTAPDLIAAANHVLQAEGLATVAAEEVRDQISFGARAMIAKGLAIRRAARTTGEVDRLLVDFLAHYEANIARHSRPFPHVLDVLRAARDRGSRLAVCTNKREGLSRLLLGELGMLDLFDAVAGRDTFAVHKPHPEHLLGAIRLAGGDAAHAIMVGDSDTDISTARAANVPSIAVTFGYTDVPVTRLNPTAVIDHYRDFEGAMMRVLEMRA